MIQQHIDILTNALRKADYDGLSADEAFVKLHSPVVTVAKVTQPKPMTLDRIFMLISPESTANLLKTSYLTDIRDKITQQDYVGVGLWATVLNRGSVITPQELGAISAVLNETEEVDGETTTIPAPVAVLSQTKVTDADGNEVSISGFPNAIDRTDFDAAWSAAGRN